MKSRGEELFKSVLQVLAILCLAAICLIILAKGYNDVTALAEAHRGNFWQALARYVFRNLAGG